MKRCLASSVIIEMQFDIDLIEKVYSSFSERVDFTRSFLGRPMTYAEKILYVHLYDKKELGSYVRGVDYVNFAPDRVAMQDATAQMALLQFMIAGKNKVAVPSSVHCDHLIQADVNAETDIKTALNTNTCSIVL